MDLAELKERLIGLSASLKNEDKGMLDARLRGLVSVYPFNEFEYILMFLLGKSIIRFDDYERFRNDYISSNRYLDLYGLAPRTFGEIWGHKHIMDLDTRFSKPGKKLDPNYGGEYDLWIDGVRVEIKAARAIHTTAREDLVTKALAYGSGKPFWMNFQQIKLDVSDVFVFIGVWTDRIVYWVLSNEEVKQSRYRSHQHRGGIEFQIGVTERNLRGFDGFQVPPNQVAEKVLEKGRRVQKG